MEWYRSIGFFNKQTYIVLVNPIVIIFWHQQCGTCPLKQTLFGWFIYKGFLTVTSRNIRTVRVVSAAAKTVHKLFVGDVWQWISWIDVIWTVSYQNTSFSLRYASYILRPPLKNELLLIRQDFSPQKHTHFLKRGMRYMFGKYSYFSLCEA